MIGTCENCGEENRRLRLAWDWWWCDCCFDELSWKYAYGNYQCTQGCCDIDRCGRGLWKGDYNDELESPGQQRK